MHDNYNTDKFIRKQREKEKSLAREKDRRDKLDRRAYEALAFEREDEKDVKGKMV